MNLKILLPFCIFAERPEVLRVIVESQEGSFCLLPHRLDCVAALVPGILMYETKEEGTVYIAVDDGVLVKAGPEVLVSVRRAVGGTDLAQLHDAVKREFLALDGQEQEVRAAFSRIEGTFMRRLAEFRHEQ